MKAPYHRGHERSYTSRLERENAQLRKENAEFKREVMELRRAELSLPDVRQLSQSCRRIVRPMSHPFPELES